MTENKRFQYNVNKNTIEQDGKFVAYVNCVDGVRIANKLNILQNENKQLKQINENNEKLKKENKQLVKEKERYKRLSEIRNETINNRILTIKEFIKNCSDNKVRRVLKELFYSEVKEFDLSAQNRELLHENEELKSELSEKDIQLDYLQNENKHFKQRNDRQAKRLDELYSLIEREDWQTLKGIIQEFQECEEQLQKEWKCYCE